MTGELKMRAFARGANKAASTAGPLFGMEIEVEGASPESLVGVLGAATAVRALGRWQVTHDRSLRNGLELISPPMPADDLAAAITSVYADVIGPAGLAPSIRTGVHIHASTLWMTPAQFLQCARTYALVEPYLFEYERGARESNIFCVPWYRAPDQAAGVRDFVQASITYVTRAAAERPTRGYPSSGAFCNKYAALNAAPLSSLGTIEFRHLRTPARADRARTWLRLVEAVVACSRREEHALETYRRVGSAQFARSVFGDILYEEVRPANLAEFQRWVEVVDVESVCEDLDPPTTAELDWSTWPTLRPAPVTPRVPPAEPAGRPGMYLHRVVTDPDTPVPGINYGDLEEVQRAMRRTTRLTLR